MQRDDQNIISVLGFLSGGDLWVFVDCVSAIMYKELSIK